ncbi:MAG: NAD(P)-binding protein [bacterium]
MATAKSKGSLEELVTRLGRLVLDGAVADETQAPVVRGLVAGIRSEVYGPAFTDARAPWAPPGVPVPRLWDGVASPFGSGPVGPPAESIRPSGRAPFAPAWRVAEEGLVAARPTLRASLRRWLADWTAEHPDAGPHAHVDDLRALVRGWVQAPALEALQGRVAVLDAALAQPFGGLEAQTVEVAWVEPTVAGWTRDVVAAVPDAELSAFVWGADEPMPAVSGPLWRAVEVEVRGARALATVTSTGREERTCCGAHREETGCFNPDLFEGATVELSWDLGPTLPAAVAAATEREAAGVSKLYRAIADAVGPHAWPRFSEAFFGPGQGDQHALFGALAPPLARRLLSSISARHRLPALPAVAAAARWTAPLVSGVAGQRPDVLDVLAQPLPGLGCCPEDGLAMGTVTVFGAGIAGLTAAHELAERGFRVQVVEKERAAVAHGPAQPLVGGMARTQWAIEADNDDGCDPCNRSSTRLHPVETYMVVGGMILPLGRVGDARFFAQLGPTLAEVGRGTDVALRLRLPRDGEEAAGSARLDPDQIRERLRVFAAGSAAALVADPAAVGRALAAVDRVEFVAAEAGCTPCGVVEPAPSDGLLELRLICGLFPGEHGYRFFPSFYRHIFDTMRRTPVYERSGYESTSTTLDNLVSTYQQVFAGEGAQAAFTRDRPASFEAFRREYVRMLTDLGFEKRDITRLITRLFRYLSSSTERRAAEFEDLSWWDFLVGATPEDRTPRWTFSPDFERHLKAAPQALVAMDATYGDARTQGNIVVQLLLDQFSAGGPTDSTLSGPTSTAWLELWKVHLQALGVQFFAGELKNICAPACPTTRGQPPQAANQYLDFCVTWPGGKAPACYCPRTNYYVLATDVVTAEAVTRDLRTSLRDHGVPGDLDGYTTRVPWEGPALLPRHYLRVVLPDRLLMPVANSNALTGHLTSTGHLPLVMEMIGLSLSRLRQLGKRGTGQIETRILRNTPGEPRVARLVVESTDPVAQVLADVEALLRPAGGGTAPLSDAEEAARWATSGVSSTSADRAAFHQAALFEEPKADRLTDELTSVIRRGLRYGATPADRLQTFAGVQYFFDQELKIARGHVYYYDTDWGLSAISQLQFWRYRRILRDQGVRGILSVDIGDWRKPSRFLGKSALDCTATEIAQEVWRQIAESLRRNSRFGARATVLPIPRPTHWYLDSALRFGELQVEEVATTTGGTEICVRVAESSCAPLIENRTPFLVNNVSDWVHRPGPEPMNPDHPAAVQPADEPHIWQADHGGYGVHFGQLVFAGTYLRTFTRMTTMEAANESARHAVNAILDHVTAFGYRDWNDTGGVVSLPSTNARPPFRQPEFAQDLTDAQRRCRVGADDLPLPALAVAGDYCDIWDPEQHELDDMGFFKRVDALLFQMGKPHLSEILGIDALADRLHPTLGDPTALLSSLIDTVTRDLHLSTAEGLGDASGLADALKRAMDWMRSKLARP